MENADEIVASLIELKFFKFTPVAELNQGIEAQIALLSDELFAYIGAFPLKGWRI